jgi:ribonuclease HII
MGESGAAKFLKVPIVDIADSKPSFAIERSLSGNISDVCGIDEAGRGPLAGPVVAAAVCFASHASYTASFLGELNDSKKLSKTKREMLFGQISELCNVGVGIASVEEIDSVNILKATMLAMKRAYLKLEISPEFAIVDGNKLPDLPCRSVAVVKGDCKSFSVAAASIIAKVTRDKIMAEIDNHYPNYGFATHAGYGTKQHMSALSSFGVTPFHRRTFAPVRQMLDCSNPHRPLRIANEVDA